MSSFAQGRTSRLAARASGRWFLSKVSSSVASRWMRRGDVENFETAVTAGLRVSAREPFCAAEHVGPLGRNQHDRTAVEVRLKVGQSLVGVGLGESLGWILPVQPRLEAHPLAEFIQ